MDALQPTPTLGVQIRLEGERMWPLRDIECINSPRDERPQRRSLGLQASHPAAQDLPEETQVFRFFRTGSQELHTAVVPCAIADYPSESKVVVIWECDLGFIADRQVGVREEDKTASIHSRAATADNAGLPEFVNRDSNRHCEFKAAPPPRSWWRGSECCIVGHATMVVQRSDGRRLRKSKDGPAERPER